MKHSIKKKYLLIGIGVCASILVLTSVAIVSGISFTGFFKAFDKTLSPGEYYERNITVRKFYNVSIRFRKENSTTDLTFSDNETAVVLKDSSGSEILKIAGVKNGHIYAEMTNYELASVATISAYSISGYEDVIEQPVNESVLSFIGAKAYITVVVKIRYEPATMAGYVIDDLTGDLLSGITIAAFENNADPNTTVAIKQTVSDSDGKYSMVFDLSSSKALDVYVDGYDVV